MTTEFAVPHASVLAPAKVNLSLRVVGRRSDGYHLLNSVMVPVSVFDRLQIAARPATRTRIELRVSGIPLANSSANLAVRAADLFLDRVGVSAEIVICLHKAIPIGAGLGGGSSDAAAVLVGLNRMLGRRVNRGTLMEWGLALGADVPFFVGGRPARVSGIGEVVEELRKWPSWSLAIVFPGTGLGTADVYRRYDASLTKVGSLSNNSSFSGGRDLVAGLLVNDLEVPACQILPGLQTLKQKLLDVGALGALMTGSGSAVFGVWADHAAARLAAKQLGTQGLWARAAEILARAPDIERGSGNDDNMETPDGR